ncbi:MAG: DNA gyrase subunit B [Lachnospiraceae bacterium]|nr:DNA gyrase subunit B [Lachnospiraceae bacterium]
MPKEQYNADSITVLEGLEAVRRRPGMYIGSTGTRGYNHLLYEIVDNSVDEHLAGHCTHIEVSLNKDGSATVRDNGRGIPVGLHKKGITAERVVLTTLHSGAKFDSSTYKVSGGLHGVGSSVVNALSESLVITIRQDGKISRDEYRRGKPVTQLVDGLLPVIGKTKETGTEISFRPDPEIFGDISFKESSIRHRLHETAYLNPGLTIHFRDDRPEEPIVRTYHEPDGISAYITNLNKDKEKVTDIIRFKGKDGGIEVEAALQFCNNYEETILGFCNNIYNVEGGMHLTGFKNRFTTMINSYARELGILKDKDDNFTGADTRSGLTAIVAVKHPDPMFEGQTKTKLGSADAARAVNNVVNEQLTLFLDKNLETLKKIIGCAEKSARIRKAEEKTRSNLLSKPTFSFDGNGKLANCEGRDPSKNEIFIVEGDSAGGSAKTARDRKFQAILPIRGKILNVEKATMDKVLANLEIKTMINAFGCGFSEGYGNDFDISRLKYDKIIIMTDADVDGSHISVLLLTFFYRFMPDLIREGHVYIATSPLYKAIPSKGEQEYIYDDAALERYRKDHKNFTLQRFKGLGEMDSTQLWETTMNPATRLLRQVEIEDVQSADHITELLMGSQVEPRRQYIQENAVYATLDV